jgi:hypothetical protein
MEGFIISLFWLLAGILLVMMIAQGFSGKVNLLSVRNLYLVGFIVYQVIAPVSALNSGTMFGFKVIDPVKAAKWILMYSYIFAAIYLLSYHRLRIARWFSSKIKVPHDGNNDGILTILSVALIIAATVAQMVAYGVPALRAASINISVALAAASCSLAGWVWGKRRLNPAVLCLAALVIGVSMLIALTGFYSRRPIISILAGFAWGAYFRHARDLSPGKLLFKTAPLFVAAGIVVAAFTAVRGGMAGQVTFRHMSQADINYGTKDLLSGQACGAVAIWIFEKYPREIDYRHLFSFKFLGYWYVPRVLWEDKPEPLSKIIAHQAKLRHVNRDVITLPPGVVGYAGAEWGFYALVLYALFYGQFTRFFDDLIRQNIDNPYIIVPVGCTIGNFLGLARGDIGIFTNLAILGFVSTFLLIRVASLMFGRTAPRAEFGAPIPQMR